MTRTLLAYTLARRTAQWGKWGAFCCLLLVSGVAGRAVAAQLPSIATSLPVTSPVATWAAQPPVIAAATVNSVTLLINSGGVQSIPALVDNRINTFPTPVSITTQWQLTNILSFVDLVAYFATPSAALSTGSADIASSRVEGRVATGRPTSFTAFTQQPIQGAGTAGGTLHLFRQLIIAPFNGQGQRTDNLELQLDLRGQPNLAAGVYRGTLTIRAVAY